MKCRKYILCFKNHCQGAYSLAQWDINFQLQLKMKGLFLSGKLECKIHFQLLNVENTGNNLEVRELR